MRPPLSTITTSLSLFVLSVAASTFIQQLPTCWQTCIANRGPHCNDSDLDCLCHFASTKPGSLLPCLRRTCDAESYTHDVSAPLRSVQSACAGTGYTFSDEAVQEAESAWSVALEGGRDGATRTSGIMVSGGVSAGVGRGDGKSSSAMGRADSTIASREASTSVSVSRTSLPTRTSLSSLVPSTRASGSRSRSTSDAMSSATASAEAANTGNTASITTPIPISTSISISVSISSTAPPILSTASSSISSVSSTSQSGSTSTSTSTSQSQSGSTSTSSTHVSKNGDGGGGGGGDGGGTPLDIGQQGGAVERGVGWVLGCVVGGVVAVVGFWV